MKKKKGFTLVELLAVIVILAVILVIAVPQIMSVIESARKGSIESTAKLIAEGAEREYTNRKILGKDTNIECSDVSSMNSNDYGTCVISFDNRGKATVSITGKGKFEGYTCNGNSINMECIKGESFPTDAQYFSYKDTSVIGEVIIKDKDKCVSYITSSDFVDTIKDNANTICSGNDFWLLKELVQQETIPSSDYEASGLEVTYIDGLFITGYLIGDVDDVVVKDKDKCVAAFQSEGVTEEDANTVCSGGAVNGITLKDSVIQSNLSFSYYELLGLEAKFKNGGGLDVVIPSEIDGKKVVGIGKLAFTTNGVTPTNINNTKKVLASCLYNSKSETIATQLHKPTAPTGLGITSVVIPSTVKSIGAGAFYGNQLTEVIIPSSVIGIDKLAFAGNKGITITNNSSLENSSEVWSEIFGTDQCDSYVLDNITNNIIKAKEERYC